MQIKVYVIDVRVPRWARRVAIYAGVPAAVMLGLSALVWADVPHSWQAGETLRAADLNVNFTALDQRTTTLESGLTARLATGAAVLTLGLVGGNVNPSSQQMVWQATTVVCTTDAAGKCTIPFLQPFPNGVLTVVAQLGDLTIPTDVFMTRSATLNDFEGFLYRNGAPDPNGTVRINYIAIGW
jgi:hypothetical protein